MFKNDLPFLAGFRSFINIQKSGQRLSNNLVIDKNSVTLSFTKEMKSNFFASVCAYLAENNYIYEMFFDNCELDNYGTKEIISCILKYKIKVQTLSITNDFITDHSAQKIAEFIEKNINLCCLHVRPKLQRNDSSISSQGITHIINAAVWSDRLIFLDLKNNIGYDDDAKNKIQKNYFKDRLISQNIPLAKLIESFHEEIEVTNAKNMELVSQLKHALFDLENLNKNLKKIEGYDALLNENEKMKLTVRSLEKERNENLTKTDGYDVLLKENEKITLKSDTLEKDSQLLRLKLEKCNEAIEKLEQTHKKECLENEALKSILRSYSGDKEKKYIKTQTHARCFFARNQLKKEKVKRLVSINERVKSVTGEIQQTLAKQDFVETLKLSNLMAQVSELLKKGKLHEANRKINNQEEKEYKDPRFSRIIRY